jgi:hypothetical protein
MSRISSYRGGCWYQEMYWYFLLVDEQISVVLMDGALGSLSPPDAQIGQHLPR